jgi:hypothetical protein
MNTNLDKQEDRNKEIDRQTDRHTVVHACIYVCIQACKKLENDQIPKTFMKSTIPSGIVVLLNRFRYSIISSVCKPTDTAAYSEYGVNRNSWTCCGRVTGSDIAIRKSCACLYTGENVSKKICPSGTTYNGLDL